jgi:hypothetical protein
MSPEEFRSFSAPIVNGQQQGAGKEERREMALQLAVLQQLTQVGFVQNAATAGIAHVINIRSAACSMLRALYV